MLEKTKPVLLFLLQPDSKNKEAKIIPFYGDVPGMLEMERSRRDSLYPGSPWIFSGNGQEIKDFRESWKAAVGRAKLQTSIGLFHDPRHSAARNMVSAGLSAVIALWLEKTCAGQLP